ncbi:MAG: MBL fold metallo-hydrolase [Gammaproteobacteria bacterium]
MARRPALALLLLASAALLVARAAPANDATCAASSGVTLQVLGSGGPDVAHGRASTAYLVWQYGRERVLLDLGAGAFLRLRESGARLQDLRHLALTHFHVDHTGDLAALTKAAFFATRSAALSLSGPRAGNGFPGPRETLQRLFGSAGAYPYLAGALDGSDGQFPFAAIEIDATVGQRSVVVADAALRIEALGVRHGTVPALAYHVTIGGIRLLFAGDQDGRDAAFWAAAEDADVLIAHAAIADAADAVASRLHAPPERLAAGAERAGVPRLVLAHWMQRSLADIERVRAQMASHYSGQVIEARDLMCIALPTRTRRLPQADDRSAPR